MWFTRSKERILIVVALFAIVDGAEETKSGTNAKGSSVRRQMTKRSRHHQQAKTASSSSPAANIAELLQQQQMQQHDSPNYAYFQQNAAQLFDQIAQEDGSLANNNHNPGGGGGVLYGMKLGSKYQENKARNPRADANYLKNYQYNGRDGPPPAGHWGDGRQLSSFSLSNLQQSGAASSPSEYIFGDSFGGSSGMDDNAVAAGGHGHQSHGWGHQSHGHGHGWKGQQDSVNNSAVGLLGFLSLLSLIQSVIRQMATTTAAAGGGRKKRESGADQYTQDVVSELLPLLISMSSAREGKVPMKCVLRPYCQTNYLLTSRLGYVSQPVLKQLSTIMETSSMEQQNSFKGNRRYAKSEPNWSMIRELRLAAKAGRKGRSCSRLFPRCPHFDKFSKQAQNSTVMGSLPLFGGLESLGLLRI